MNVLSTFERSRDSELKEFAPKRYAGILQGTSMVQLASAPILAMRHFSKTKTLPSELVARVSGVNS